MPDGPAHSPDTAVTNTMTIDTSVLGDGIPAYWQSSDVEALSRGADRTPDTVSGPTPSRPNATSSLLPPTGSSSAAGLSTGAKAGIGAGVPLIVIAALLLGFFFWKRHRGRAVADEGIKIKQGESGTEKSVHVSPDYQRHEMPDHSTQELPAEQGYSEAPTHELLATAQNSSSIY